MKSAYIKGGRCRLGCPKAKKANRA